MYNPEEERMVYLELFMSIMCENNMGWLDEIIEGEEE